MPNKQPKEKTRQSGDEKFKVHKYFGSSGI
jgi:hypothetical protein